MDLVFGGHREGGEDDLHAGSESRPQPSSSSPWFLARGQQGEGGRRRDDADMVDSSDSASKVDGEEEADEILMARDDVSPTLSTPPPNTGTDSPVQSARVYLPDVDHEVFKHFRRIKVDEGKSQQYECRYCCNVFSGAATRCAQHLASWRKMRRREVALCKEAPSEVRAAIRKKYEAKAAAADQRRQATSNAIASVTSGGKRSRITDYLETDAAAAKRDAHEALALMFVACRISERVAEHPLFINAVCAIRDSGTGYAPSTRTLIGGAGLRLCCENIDRGLSGVKASWKRTGVTISSDMMTDKNGRPQANVFLVNESGAVFKDSVDCRMETKTGGYVASILRPVVEEVGPDNVVAFCTDGGSNYAVACNELIAEWPHIQHVPCATHALDLFMEDVGKMTWAKKVVDTAGEMSSFVRNHHWTRGNLRTPALVGAKMLQALKPAGTRFGTQYIVVSRLCEPRQSLAQMVVSDVWKGWAVGDRKKSADKFASQVLDDAWWRTAEFFSKLMKLPFMAMRKTDGDAKGMMGRMYDVMLQLTEDVGTVVEEDEEQLSYSDKVNIRRLLKNRWGDSLACPMHVAGRILNPANQDEDIFGSDAECTRVTYITQHAEHLCNYGKEGDDGDDIGEVLMELQDGVRAFLDMKGSFEMGDAIAQRNLVKQGKYDMVKWWQWHGTDAPKLAALAIRNLSQPVSASPCERGWSTWDGVHTARRNRLGYAKCRDLVFVAHNWSVVRNWHSRADVMPGVVLGNIPEPPVPEGYNVMEGDEEEEEEGEDDILEDEYA
ncbi:unnamed protein product [Closterium sp. NIES-65]|nr:unnamed protein product [Closterium sp. NIES-65]